MGRVFYGASLNSLIGGQDYAPYRSLVCFPIQGIDREVYAIAGPED